MVGAFAAFAADSGVRLTFFPNGCYRSWTDNAAALQPLVDSGQVALGNHTWSHPDLTTLPDAEVVEQIRRNRDFLRSVFGVRDTPFFRPPYGSRNERIDRIAADQGHPTVVLWNGTLDDFRVLTGGELMAAARQWFAAQRIVIGHANHPTVTTVYGELLGLALALGGSRLALLTRLSGSGRRLLTLHRRVRLEYQRGPHPIECGVQLREDANRCDNQNQQAERSSHASLCFHSFKQCAQLLGEPRTARVFFDQ